MERSRPNHDLSCFRGPYSAGVGDDFSHHEHCPASALSAVSAVNHSVHPVAPRRLLIIACAFPPTGGPGVQRSVKFAKYLPRHGWRPTVWAARRMEGLPVDASLLADLPPEVSVHRLGRGSGLHTMRRKLRGLADGQGVTSRLAKAIDWRLAARISRSPLPDDYVSWARASVRLLQRLIRRGRFDAIHSTFSPASNHLLALEMKRSTGLPWLADFRDLWTDDYRYCESSPARRAAHRQLEQTILETADAVVGVTERQTAILAGHVPAMRHKFTTITNGFDPADFEFEEGAFERSDERFTLAHVGRLDHWRASAEWFAALRRFVAGLGAQRHRFTLRIVGHADRAMREMLRGTGVSCVFTGNVRHGEALREMRLADALLLSVPSGPNADSVIPAKLFEYLAARRPVLVVGPPGGESERIVQACRAGLTVGFHEQAIAEALAHLYGRWAAKQPLTGCKQADLEQYSRIRNTGQLAEIINRLVAEPGPPRSSEHRLMETYKL